MSSHVIPKNLNLGAVKPTTIPAYARRVESIATNAQTFGENQVANIVLDTSTPGSFLDPSQSLLQFDIEITNTNPYIDYINLSNCGLASIIQELRIICQGTPVEEMLDYNTMFEMFMDLGGAQQDEFKLYMENGWRAPITPGHSTEVNFVKPPMVDRQGVILAPNLVNMYGDPLFSGYHNEDGQQTLQTTTNLKNFNGGDITALNFANQPDRTKGQNTLTAATAGYLNSSSVTNQRGPVAGISTFPIGATALPAVGTGATSNAGNYIHYWEPTGSRWTGSSAGGSIRAQSWTNRIDNTYVTWPSTLRPEPLGRNEARVRQETQVKKYRVQDYLQYLSNVKNLPVGVAPAKSFIKGNDGLQRPGATKIGASILSDINTSTSQIDGGETNILNWNFASVSSHMVPTASSGAGKFQYTVTLPIFSGLLGVWAEKQFPTMLISPGSFYFQIKFAKAAQAFQCAMDPCRRVFGTYRDYVPNAGLPSFYQTEFRGQVLNPSKCGVVAAATGDTTSTYMALTIPGTTGADFSWNGILALFPPTSINGTSEALSVNLKNGYRNNVLGNVNTTDAAQKVALQGGTGVDFIDAVGQGEGYTTGNAKPQYVPRRTPWLLGGNGFSDPAVNSASVATSPSVLDCQYVREREVCYGTHLRASTAQVRRTTQKTNPFLGGNQSSTTTNIDKVPTYVISNLKYIGMQTILPDEVTASIVRAAASSDISLHAQSVRSYRSVLNNSTSQNVILPIKVASANSMWVVFQNQMMVENVNYLSLTRICPFTNFQWNKTSVPELFVGSNIPPTVTHLNTQKPFSIQLRIGNELLPQQPIETLNQIVTELQRSVHGLSDMECSLPTIGSFRTSRLRDNLSMTVDSLSTEFLPIVHNDFCTPYIPVEALDDQTITNNPAFLDYHQAWNTGFSNWNAFNDRGTYVLPEYLPPVSKFLLGFDLDTFPGTNETARSGRYLGNAPLTLQMTNCVAPNLKSMDTDAQSNTIIATCFVLHDIRFSIMAGGQVLSYY